MSSPQAFPIYQIDTFQGKDEEAEPLFARSFAVMEKVLG